MWAGAENSKPYQIDSSNFSPDNEINHGAFGRVYKGVLKGGKLAAIKFLSNEFGEMEMGEFLTEINTISYTQHPNVVELYGCCVEGDHQILVYSYIDNNSSLAHTLLGGNIYFDWQTRCRICIGIARGLAFLHEEVQPHIVHGELTGTNILLDKDLTPKISDVGLAKLVSVTRVIITASVEAPEVIMTRESDVYSYGILLVEIVGGRYIQSIVEQTWEHYKQKKLVELVDISLNKELCAEEACKYLKIALLCIQIDPKLRPTMSSVIKMLTGEIDIDESKITKPVRMGRHHGIE